MHTGSEPPDDDDDDDEPDDESDDESDDEVSPELDSEVIPVVSLELDVCGGMVELEPSGPLEDPTDVLGSATPVDPGAP